MSTQVCPVCGADYLAWVTTCTICGVALVSPSQAPDPLRLPEDQQVVYELSDWSLGLQTAAAQELAESGIPHGWDGTDLVVHLDHEGAVDAILAAIEEANPGVVGADHLDGDGVPAAAGEPGDAAGDEDDDETPGDGNELAYELDEWPAPDRERLTARLLEAGLDHRWETPEVLVVASADEEVVEALLDEIEFPDALASEPDDDADEASFELMSELFVAADRLKRNPRDPDGLAGLARVVEDADRDHPPYGVEPVLWTQAVDDANDLADRIAGRGDADGDGFADEVVDADGEPVYVTDDVMGRARALRDLLRPFV